MTNKEYRFVLPDETPPDVTELRPRLIIDEDGDLRLQLNGKTVGWISLPSDYYPLQLHVNNVLSLAGNDAHRFNLERLFNN